MSGSKYIKKAVQNTQSHDNNAYNVVGSQNINVKQHDTARAVIVGDNRANGELNAPFGQWAVETRQG